MADCASIRPAVQPSDRPVCFPSESQGGSICFLEARSEGNSDGRFLSRLGLSESGQFVRSSSVSTIVQDPQQDCHDSGDFDTSHHSQTPFGGLVAPASPASSPLVNVGGSPSLDPVDAPRSPSERCLPRASSCPDWGDVISYIDGSVSVAHRKSRLSDFLSYVDWCSALNLVDTPENCISYLYSIILPRASSSQIIQRHLSAIDFHRSLSNLPKHGSNSIVARFLEATRSRLPKSARYLEDPSDCWDPRPIARVAANLPIPTEDFHEVLRLKTLILIRSIALLRSSDCAGILLDSIAVDTDIAQRHVVKFRYRGKNAIRAKLAYESNYLEFLPDSPLCPATVLLQLASFVRSLNIPDQNSLFVSVRRPFKPVVPQTLACLVWKFMKAQGVPEHFKSHSLRTMTSETLALLGIPDADVEKRAGWSNDSSSSRVRAEHYRSRFVHPNFAKIILLDPIVSPSSLSLPFPLPASGL